MTEDKTDLPEQVPASEPDPSGSRYPELDDLQQEVAKRLRDNQRFLEHFLDEDFPEEVEDEAETSPDDFEEL